RWLHTPHRRADRAEALPRRRGPRIGEPDLGRGRAAGPGQLPGGHRGALSMDRNQLADFLRTRREALQPEDVGLPRGGLEVYCQMLYDLDQDQALLIFTATPCSDSHEKLQLLSVIGAQKLRSPS